MEYFFTCPYCWKEISFLLDTSVQGQTYIEDCEVCCNPIEITYEISGGEVTLFDAVKLQ
jgi:transcription elongation factor Elf1